jgi:pyruvate dehydrogenase E1 component alpha subunit
MAIHSSIDEMHPTEDISSLAQGYGMPAVIVDGQDVFAIAEVVEAAVERARAGKGPTFIEAKVLRFAEHDIGTPDLRGWELRSDEEREEMHKREPVALATERVLAESILSQGEIDQIIVEAEAEIAEIEKFADESPIARPPEAELLAAVYAP